MTQEEFVKKNQPFWDQFSQCLDKLENPQKNKNETPIDNFPAQYRKICHHLDLAKSRFYGTYLLDFLERLILKGHQYLYRHRVNRLDYLGKIFRLDFPRAVRREKKLLLLSALLFLIPLLTMSVMMMIAPEMIYTILDPQTVKMYEGMHNKEKIMERSFSDNLLMLGYYIWNNTGIGFRTFGGGLLFGLGSLFFLVFNGVYLGSILGYLFTVKGNGSNIFAYVIGHGAFELTAIVIAGLTGLKLGLALVKPGRFSRLQSLRRAGARDLPLIYGFMLMFFIAAFIEAFWSSLVMENMIKYLVGLVLWIVVILYFIFQGRTCHAGKTDH